MSNNINFFEDETYSSNYQALLFAETEDVVKCAEVKRKCLAFSNAASFKVLNNASSCALLRKQLNDYSEHISNGNESIYDDQIKFRLKESKAVNNSFQWKTGVQNIDILSKIQSLSCGTGHDVVCIAETVPHEEFQLFYNSLSNRKDTQSLDSKQTTRNFEPKPCSSKDSRFEYQTKVIKPNAQEYESQNKGPTKGNYGVFKTAKDELNLNNIKKYGSMGNCQNSNPNNAPKKKLGLRRNIASKFVSPMLSANLDSGDDSKSSEWEDEVDERLKNIEPRMVELIKSEIMDNGTTVDWIDIAGLEFAKTAIQEAVVWPMLRPDIFTGLRRPPKGILLFGPPGTGKTLIGKCVASQSKSTFFSISASSLTSKWVGDGEKMVRALFAVARCYQPAVIFIDEIDSLLSQRSDQEHESSRRIKTEFLVQLDGATTDNDERLLVIGATNRPQELDEAARRRFVKRLYIPLPDLQARLQLIERLMNTEKNSLNTENFSAIAQLSDGYSGADMRNLCSDACLGPIRCIDMTKIQSIQATEVRPVVMDDFKKSLNRVRSSVSPKDLEQYILWDNTYGSGTL